MSKQAPAAARGLVVKVENALPRKRKSEEPRTKPPVPRIARMLALAYWAEARIEDGTYESYADVARAIGVTRARMTQIAQLRYLSPRIQDSFLRNERTASERAMRRVTSAVDWTEQERHDWDLHQSSSA